MTSICRRVAFTALLSLAALPLRAQQPFITVASTTSTEDSGLFPHLLPAFTKASGIGVRVVALGTGQALDVGRRGDCDVVFVHDRPAEEKWVAEGAGGPRHPVMYNDFILIGPATDPAGVASSPDPLDALRRIAGMRAIFISRGDRSGTNAAELRLWAMAGVDPATGRGQWYREIGQGMGPALNMAAAQGAYVLADRGTWLAFHNRQQLKILVAGDTKLFNQYGVMLVNPQRHPQVKVAEGQAFIDWLISPAGQATIAAYKIEGEQLFFPDANVPGR